MHHHAALAGRRRGYLCQREMAANDLMLSDLLPLTTPPTIIRLSRCPIYPNMVYCPLHQASRSGAPAPWPPVRPGIRILSLWENEEWGTNQDC